MANLKKQLGSIKIQNNIDFKEIKTKLKEIYNIHYGVTNKIRSFFNKYIDFETKKRLILSIKFYNSTKQIFIPKCFISEDICIDNDVYNNKLNCNYDDCQLKDNVEFNKSFNEFIGFLYRCYRNKFVHEGEIYNFLDKESHTSFDILKEGSRIRQFEIKLSSNKFKEIIIKGIKQYLIQDIIE